LRRLADEYAAAHKTHYSRAGFTILSQDKLDAAREEYSHAIFAAGPSLIAIAEAASEARIQMLAAKAELLHDESRVAKVFAGRITEWAAALQGVEP